MQIDSLIGKKNFQKQGFLQDGKRVPLSGVVVLGNKITQIKTQDKEGYNALQLGIDTKKKSVKSIVNHSKKAGLEQTPRFFKEIRVETTQDIVLGSEINISDVFNPGDIVDVTGTSKGKGFAGGVKRHGFKGGPRTHGQSDRERAPGSIGQTTTPGRVYKGKRMAGRMGQDTVTVKNLEIIEITSDGVLLIKGLVPGSLNSLLIVKKVGENKKFVPLYKEVVEEVLEEVPVAEEVKKEAAEEVTEKTEDISKEVAEEATSPEKVEEVKADSQEVVEETKQEEVETKEEEKKEEVTDGNS